MIAQSQSIDPPDLTSFGSGLNVAVVGASGGIGSALVQHLEHAPSVSKLFRLSRSCNRDSEVDNARLRIDMESESSIAEAAAGVERAAGELHLVLVATGILHDGDEFQPEKSWRGLSAPAMERAFRVNTIGPALIAKHFLPLLARDRKTACATLSARVGSIEDNHLGGWHAYRASKAALNMLIKTFSIELARRNPDALCIGLHPGTVDTPLSKPFQRGVREGKLVSPTYAARRLLTVLDTLSSEDSGGLYAWDGRRLPF